MLNGFGIFGGAIGLILSMWFIHVGFLVKKILKEHQETNRVLREMADASSGLGAGSKAA
jgi:hypothetical protein